MAERALASDDDRALPADEPPRGTLGTVRNAVVLLELLADGAAFQQLTDLAERSGMSVPTVHRLLRSLAVAGLVEQDPRSLRYGLGPALVRLSERYLSRLPVLRAVAPYLVELRDSTGTTVLAGVLMRGHVVYVDRVDGADAGGVFREHTRMRPALDTAAGRLLAARADDEVWAEARALAETSATARDRSAWASARHAVLADGERLEAAVPLAGDDGVRAAIVATATPGTLSEHDLVERVVPQLTRAATAASRTLAHG